MADTIFIRHANACIIFCLETNLSIFLFAKRSTKWVDVGSKGHDNHFSSVFLALIQT